MSEKKTHTYLVLRHPFFEDSTKIDPRSSGPSNVIKTLADAERAIDIRVAGNKKIKRGVFRLVQVLSRDTVILKRYAIRKTGTNDYYTSTEYPKLVPFGEADLFYTKSKALSTIALLADDFYVYPLGSKQSLTKDIDPLK